MVRGGHTSRPWHLPGVVTVSLTSAAVLVPWVAYLAGTLPTGTLLTSWSSAWVGFDVLLTATLAATGLLARSRNPLWPSAAFASAALLVADAWFDVTTSGSGGLLVPVLSAALLELPLAALLVRYAVRATRTAFAVSAAVTTVRPAPAPEHAPRNRSAEEGTAVEG